MIRRRLTFANLVSLLALFVAIGGTAMASVIITSNSTVSPALRLPPLKVPISA